MILDEAQAIKNASSNQARAIKKLPAASRIVLTGTPVENHLGDLWSIFDFCCPGLLGTAAQFKTFVKGLNKQQDARAFGTLRRLVRPYILRRLKTDPSRRARSPGEDRDAGRMRLVQETGGPLRARRRRSRLPPRKRGRHRAKGLVLAVLMQLKQICNHPRNT